MSTQPVDLVQEYKERQNIRPRLFNAGEEVLEVQYSGIFYVFQPKQYLEIGDRLVFQRDQYGKPLKKKPLVIDGKGGEGSAVKIAEILLERYGDRGIAVTFGEEEDKGRIERAYQRWLGWKVGIARIKRNEWLLKMDRIMREPGAVPPPQPQDVRDALTFLEKYEKGLIGRKRFISKVDSEEFDTKAEALAYNKRRWPDVVAKDPEGHVLDLHAGLDGQPKKDVVPPPEPKPPKTLDVDVSYLLGEARKAGVELAADEIAAVMVRDPEVTGAVVKKVAVAMAKPPKGRKGGASAQQAQG